MSEQPTAHQTYRVPHQYPEVYTSRSEKQPSHLERVQHATAVVLSSRNARLERVLDIDIEDDESLLRKLGHMVADLFMGRQTEQKESPRGTNFRQLIIKESEIGAQLFSPIPAYDRREFYCFDDRMWIWHEERMNAHTGKYDVMTVNYTLSDRGILKTYGEDTSRYIEGQELDDFVHSTEAYASQVQDKLYAPLEEAA